MDDASVTWLGRGRSGTVYRCRDGAGRDVACKVFTGDPAGKVVHYLLSGAPNPYGWNEDAVRSALYRRAILHELLDYWFGPSLTVAGAYQVGWNEKELAFELHTRFVAGRPAALHQPFSAGRDGEYLDLRRRVMRPLQKKLADVGLDGLVWQAGRGNPVAVNNFLRVGGDGDEHRWVWIDLESGVPAVAPINPLDLLLFYLPKSWHHRRFLFDDVDTRKLRRYARRHAPAIEARIGAQRFAALVENIDRLERHQHAWRSQPRVERSIAYRLRKRQIGEETAAYYARRAALWYLREARLGLRALAAGSLRLAAAAVRRIVRFDYQAAAVQVVRFVSSQRFRAQLARKYVAARIDRWESREQLTAEEARLLRDQLRSEDAASYITDFGIHIALKPVVKAVQYTVVPLLLAAGRLNPASAGLLLVLGGPAIRTLYTLGRVIQSGLRRERVPLVALGVGLLPVVGNTAYGVQILARGAEEEGKLAGFIVYDTLTIVGEMIPIWGGRDTATEHWMNRLADWVVRRRAPAPLPAAG